MLETLANIDEEVDQLEKEVMAAKKRVLEARRKRPRELVQDYVFQTTEGEVKLSELFGDKDDLLMVHNMGYWCEYCTLWADGFNGQLSHYENRAAFVVSSPNTPEEQEKLKASRKWNFRMVSNVANRFADDMGFVKAEDGKRYFWPGISSFHKDLDGKIYRNAKTSLGPGDNFCPVWPMFDLLQDGPNGWEPDYGYGVK